MNPVWQNLSWHLGYTAEQHRGRGLSLRQRVGTGKCHSRLEAARNAIHPRRRRVFPLLCCSYSPLIPFPGLSSCELTISHRCRLHHEQQCQLERHLSGPCFKPQHGLCELQLSSRPVRVSRRREGQGRWRPQCRIARPAYDDAVGSGSHLRGKLSSFNDWTSPVFLI